MCKKIFHYLWTISLIQLIRWIQVFEHVTSSVKDQDASTAPTRHMSETGSLNCLQSMLLWFITFPGLTDFLPNLGKSPFDRKNASDFAGYVRMASVGLVLPVTPRLQTYPTFLYFRRGRWYLYWFTVLTGWSVREDVSVIASRCRWVWRRCGVGAVDRVDLGARGAWRRVFTRAGSRSLAGAESRLLPGGPLQLTPLTACNNTTHTIAE